MYDVIHILAEVIKKKDVRELIAYECSQVVQFLIDLGMQWQPTLILSSSVALSVTIERNIWIHECKKCLLTTPLIHII